MRVSMNRNASPIFRLSDVLEYTSGPIIFKNQNVTKISLSLTF